MVGLNTHVSLRKPGAMYPARRMAKAIYSMKIELLCRGNETVKKYLTAHELQVVQRFNRYVDCMFLQL